MIIAYVCDEHYLPLLKVSMASVKRYNKNVEFAILTDKPFEVEGAKVYTFAPDTERFKFRAKDRMGAGVYYKLYLPKLPYDKVLFLDCDILCQRPLKSLWAQDCPFICGTESPTYYNEPNYQTLHNGNSEEAKILEYQAAGLLKVC